MDVQMPQSKTIVNNDYDQSKISFITNPKSKHGIGNESSLHFQNHTTDTNQDSKDIMIMK